MSDAIITALITGFFVAVPTLVATVVSNNKSQALITYRIDRLEDKVNKHNQIVERTYKLEQEQAVIREQVKVANHRIDDLEE